MAITATNGERGLTAEMLIAFVLVFVYATRRAGGLPNPRQFAGLVLTYGLLAIMSAFGEQPARLASAFGLLILTVIAIATMGEFVGAIGSAVNSKGNPVHLDQTKGS